MAEARIDLPGGTANVTGSPEEVARILRLIGAGPPAPAQPQPRAPAKTPGGGSSRRGPRSYVLELKAEGFFKGMKRSISSVREGLEARGQIYPVTTLSGALLDLVKKRELGRVKEGGVWMYVHRD